MMRAEITIEGEVFSIDAAGPPAVEGASWIAPAGSVKVSAPFRADRFYRHGWHSWAVTRWVDLNKPPVVVDDPGRSFQADDLTVVDGVRHAGSSVGAISVGEGNALVVGALGLDGHVVAAPGELQGVCAADPVEWFIGYGNAETVLEQYASAIASRLGNDHRHPGQVWCSWYSYYEDITEAEMKRTLAGLDELPFDVVQIDDGWQRCVGDWDVNDDFPSGMAAMAAAISGTGRRPGLWMAPFIARRGSETFAEHPHWFISDEDGPVAAGINWGEPYYGLDLTNPEVRQHVSDVIWRAVDWGYTYLKLDFLFAAALPGRRYDDRPGREAVYRSGIELIRAAAGPDTYLLACGSPIVPSIGVFNGMRVGQDVAPYWDIADDSDLSLPSTRYGVSNSLARLWLAPVVVVDPDVVYFRSRDNEMTSDQMAALQDIATICEFVATSDPPHWLTPRERAELERYLSHRPDVRRLDRYRFVIDDREVDFRPASLDA